MTETALRDRICQLGQSMFARGLTFGSSGNISVRVDDGWLMTPTGATLGTLDPARLSGWMTPASLSPATRRPRKACCI